MGGIAQCRNCNATYDGTAYAPGYTFACTSCGTTVTVGSSNPPPPRAQSYAPPVAAPYGYAQPQPQQGIPGLCIAGFIFSFLCSILGLIFCLVSLGECKRRNAGVGLCIAGIIISILNIALGIAINVSGVLN